MFAVLAVYGNCFAQDSQFYVGNSKYYCYPNPEIQYTANITSTIDGIYRSLSYATALNLYENGDLKKYSSTHGDYISFQYNCTIFFGKHSSNSEQFIFFSKTRQDGRVYAFVEGTDKNLYIVDVYTDKIVSTLETNFYVASDFRIVVVDYSSVNDPIIPTFWLINGGYVKIFIGFPSASSVKSLTAEETAEDDGPIYNLNGQKMNDTPEGFYIQNGEKKYISK